MHLVNNPHLTFDAQEELDIFLGPGFHAVHLRDRKKLPVTEAMLKEVQRLSSIRPYTGKHHARETVCVDEYEVPHNTPVCILFHSVHLNA